MSRLLLCWINTCIVYWTRDGRLSVHSSLPNSRGLYKLQFPASNGDWVRTKRAPHSRCMETVNEAISTSLTSVSLLGVTTPWFLTRIGRDPSVSKSNWLHVVIFRFFFSNSKYSPIDLKKMIGSFPKVMNFIGSYVTLNDQRVPLYNTILGSIEFSLLESRSTPSSTLILMISNSWTMILQLLTRSSF
jgi:hypothetical protein